MTNLSLIDNSVSPFDSIRRFDEHGNEYWLARELMPLLGYQQWRRFESSIKQAIENLELNEDKVSDHFLPVVAKSHGRDGSEYKLTRYACYMTALCCDGRKIEVASAKKYFAIKTRQAETVIPQQDNRIRELELMLLLEQQKEKTAKAELEAAGAKQAYVAKCEAIKQLHGENVLALLQGNPDAVIEKVTTVTETIQIKDGKTKISYNGVSTAQLGKQLGFKTGAEFESYLNKIGGSEFIKEGERAIKANYIPVNEIANVKRLVSQKRLSTTRQLLLGE